MNQLPDDRVGAVPPDPVVMRQPVGELVRATKGPWGIGTATFDLSETWRFRLSRVWDQARSRCVFVMLNPSTATEGTLDPTVTRCVSFAKAWGHGALEVVNLFAYRATKPTDLKTAADPVGPNNDKAIAAAAAAADLVIVAWGAHAAHLGRDAKVTEILRDCGADMAHLRLTKEGHPGHPLYIPSGVTPRPWRGPVADI